VGSTSAAVFRRTVGEVVGDVFQVLWSSDDSAAVHPTKRRDMSSTHPNTSNDFLIDTTVFALK
jgi:hypothetical protein